VTISRGSHAAVVCDFFFCVYVGPFLGVTVEIFDGVKSGRKFIESFSA